MEQTAQEIFHVATACILLRPRNFYGTFAQRILAKRMNQHASDGAQHKKFFDDNLLSPNLQ